MGKRRRRAATRPARPMGPGVETSTWVMRSFQSLCKVAGSEGIVMSKPGYMGRLKRDTSGNGGISGVSGSWDGSLSQEANHTRRPALFACWPKRLHHVATPSILSSESENTAKYSRVRGGGVKAVKSRHTRRTWLSCLAKWSAAKRIGVAAATAPVRSGKAARIE